MRRSLCLLLLSLALTTAALAQSQRVRATRPDGSAVWLNPEPERLWDYRHSIELIRTIFNNRMFPLTLAGLERAMRELNK